MAPLTAGFRGESAALRALRPLVFRELDARRKLLFHEDEQGNISRRFIWPDAPARGHDPRNGREPAAQSPLKGSVAVCGLMFLSAFLFWLMLAFTRRAAKSTRFRRSFLSGLISLVGWLLVGGCTDFPLPLREACGEPEQVVYGTPQRELEYMATCSTGRASDWQVSRPLKFDRRMVPRLFTAFRPRALLCWSRLPGSASASVSVLLEFAFLHRYCGLAHHQVLKERRESSCRR